MHFSKQSSNSRFVFARFPTLIISLMLGMESSPCRISLSCEGHYIAKNNKQAITISNLGRFKMGFREMLVLCFHFQGKKEKKIFRGIKGERAILPQRFKYISQAAQKKCWYSVPPSACPLLCLITPINQKTCLLQTLLPLQLLLWLTSSESSNSSGSHTWGFNPLIF